MKLFTNYYDYIFAFFPSLILLNIYIYIIFVLLFRYINMSDSSDDEIITVKVI